MYEINYGKTSTGSWAVRIIGPHYRQTYLFKDEAEALKCARYFRAKLPGNRKQMRDYSVYTI